MKYRLGWVVGIFAVFALAGCGGATRTGDEALPDPTIKFVNASADSSQLAFSLNDVEKAAALPYLSATSGFVRVPFISELDGGYDLSCRIPGGVEDADRIANVLDRDTHYVLSAIGLLDPQDGDEEKRLRLALTPIDRVSPTGDKARLYILHAFCRSPGNDTPQITFQTPGDNPQFKVENIDFGSTRDIVVDSGFQDFEARRADADGENIYARQSVNLKSGGIYFVIIGGIQDSPDTSRRPTIQFIEMEPK
jgi:hypothetical protein